MKLPAKFKFLILQLFVFADIPVQRYLKDVRLKTYNSAPVFLYVLTTLILFGIVLGAFVNCQLKREDIKVLIFLFIVNVIGAITCFAYFHQTPSFFIILIGFILSNLFFIKNEKDKDE